MNAVRLLFGTLTVLPVRPPAIVDRRVAGWAMALAPLAGLVLALLVAVPLALAEEYADAPPLLLGVLTVGALALLTRGMHLDGLADVADGLGSGRRGEDALAVMKKSDIGPFGVLTLVLVLLLQVAALAECIAAGTAAPVLVAALIGSRALLAPLCTPSFPAARPDGLGSLVAGSVPLHRVIATAALALFLMVGALVLDAAFLGAGPGAAAIGAGVALGIVCGWLLARHCRTRFGGVTGDVYGAAVETAFTAILVIAALA